MGLLLVSVFCAAQDILEEEGGLLSVTRAIFVFFWTFVVQIAQESREGL